MVTIYTILINARDGGWELSASQEINNYIETNNVKHRKASEICNHEELYTLFSEGIINDKDIFLFPTFFDDSLLTIARFLRQYNKPRCKIVAFWDNLLPHEYLSGNLTTKVKPYIHDFEMYRLRAVMLACNEIYFDNRQTLDIFAQHIPKSKISKQTTEFFLNKCKVHIPPLSYLQRQHTIFMENNKKPNNVVIGGRIIETGVNKAIELEFIKRLGPVICPKTDITYDDMQRKIASSKICFLPYMTARTQQIIHECALLGTLPVVSSKYKFLMPIEDLIYPEEWTNTIQNYSLHANDLRHKIQNVLENYKELLIKLKEVVDKYNSLPFLEYISTKI